MNAGTQPSRHACHIVSCALFLSPMSTPPILILPCLSCDLLRLAGVTQTGCPPACLPADLQSTQSTQASATLTMLALRHSLADCSFCKCTSAWRHKGSLSHLPDLEALSSALRHLHAAGGPRSCSQLSEGACAAVAGLQKAPAT